MGRTHNEEFKREAVRIALTSGLKRRQVASDLGVGFSTLAKWVQKSKPGDLPPSARGHVLLAHIREQHHLSLGSYGRPRMTQELKEAGVLVGHRRVGRLMRDNRIYVVITHKYKATTDSHHRFNIAPYVLDRNFTAHLSNQKWAGDISYI